MNGISINDRLCGDGCPPYVIAELSANHNGSIETAKRIITEAKRNGADAVKLQTYKPDTITLDSDSDDFLIEDGLWAGRRLYDLYEDAHTPWEWHPELFQHANDLEMTIFSSPFDNSAVDFLENLGAPAYKIASFEAIDHELIKYAASTKKPIIISTGMANQLEIEEAIQAARDGGASQIAILHCVSGYPAPAEDYNLATIRDMKEQFGLVTGLSDHTLDNTTAIASVALGAAIIEKHFTLNRQGGGPDDSFSLEPNDLKDLCRGARIAWQAVGSIDYGQKSSERGNVKFRRSLYFVEDLKAGDVIKDKDIRSVRPGYGLPPKYQKELIGRQVAKNISKNTATAWDLID